MTDHDTEKIDERASKRDSADSFASAPTAPTNSASLSATSTTSSDADLERLRTLSQHASRVETLRIQHTYTVGESGRGTRSRASSGPLPEFGGGKPYPPLLPAQEDYVVEFDGPDDPIHPQNWTLRRK